MQEIVGKNLDTLLEDVERRTKEGYKHGRFPSGLAKSIAKRRGKREVKKVEGKGRQDDLEGEPREPPGESQKEPTSPPQGTSEE